MHRYIIQLLLYKIAVIKISKQLSTDIEIKTRVSF